MKVFRIMHISPDRIRSLMFIMVKGSLQRHGLRYNSMLGPEPRSYDGDDRLYDFNGNKYGRAFFFLEDANTPFLKPPDNKDDNDGLLAALTDMGVQILRIQCNPDRGP